MQLNEYHFKAMETAKDAKGYRLAHRITGLQAETGEVSAIFQKHFRKGNPLAELPKDKLVDELGDVLWYVVALADYLNESLESIATKNLSKLAQREVDGTVTDR
jgi:NTP pyrophosphatase (non-canonical NTP hydrolase)